MTTTKQITKPELKVGNIAHFHGARFEITSTLLVEDREKDANGRSWLPMVNGWMVR